MRKKQAVTPPPPAAEAVTSRTVLAYVIELGTATTAEVAEHFGISLQHALGCLNRCAERKEVLLMDDRRTPYLWQPAPLAERNSPIAKRLQAELED